MDVATVADHAVNKHYVDRRGRQPRLKSWDAGGLETVPEVQSGRKGTLSGASSPRTASVASAERVQ